MLFDFGFDMSLSCRGAVVLRLEALLSKCFEFLKQTSVVNNARVIE